MKLELGGGDVATDVRKWTDVRRWSEGQGGVFAVWLLMLAATAFRLARLGFLLQ